MLRSAIFCLSVLLLITANSWPDTGGYACLHAAPVPNPWSTVQSTSTRQCKVIPVELPVTGASGQQVLQSLKRFSDQAPDAIQAKDRAVAILEFKTSLRTTGAGSDFGACSSIAEFLTTKMERVETVAYIRTIDRQSDKEIAGQLNGHAVLIAIAAKHIAMASNTAIGKVAGENETPAGYVQVAYEDIANRRLLSMPTELVMSMLNKDLGLYKVDTQGATQWVSRQQRDRLEVANRNIIDSKAITPVGECTNLSGAELHRFRMIKYLAEDKSDLARQLNVSLERLSSDHQDDRSWTAMAIDMPEFLDDRSARWIKRAVLPAMIGRNANLLMLNFKDCSGSPDASVKVARFVATLRDADIRTVAVIEQSASSGAGFVAMACDQILMQNDATIGGFGLPPVADAPPEGSIDPARGQSYQTDARFIANEKEKDWSIVLAMIDAQTTVGHYRSNQTGQSRLLSELEHGQLNDAQQWKRQGVVDTKNGIPAAICRQYGISALSFGSIESVQGFYQLDQPPTAITKSPTDRWVESLALFLTTPGIPFLLLLAGCFCISTEMSSPGLGVPGFAGAVCFVAYFWSQFFHGNAEWFEVLMFVIGAAFVLIEVFVIPGFGIFGIGGGLMMAVSIVLAAQSFIIPQTYRQLEQLPHSLFPLIGAGFGVVSAMLILPKLIPNIPFLRGIILSPRAPQETGLEEARDREATADYSYLQDQVGETVTRLMPSGRAKFGDRVYDVLTRGLVVDKGCKVKVIEAVANRIVVQQRDDNA